MRLQGGAGVGLGDAGDDLDAVGAVEHEGEPADRLLVAAHERHEPVGVGAGGQRGGEVVGGEHAAVLGDPGVVDAAEAAAERGGVDQADGDRLAVAQVVGRPISRAWASVWP